MNSFEDHKAYQQELPTHLYEIEKSFNFASWYRKNEYKKQQLYH